MQSSNSEDTMSELSYLEFSHFAAEAHLEADGLEQEYLHIPTPPVRVRDVLLHGKKKKERKEKRTLYFFFSLSAQWMSRHTI